MQIQLKRVVGLLSSRFGAGQISSAFSPVAAAGGPGCDGSSPKKRSDWHSRQKLRSPQPTRHPKGARARRWHADARAIRRNRARCRCGRSRQRSAAGASLVGPAVEVEIDAGIVQKRAGDAQRPRIARHWHGEPTFLQARQFGEDQARYAAAAAALVIIGWLFQQRQDEFGSSPEISASTGCRGSAWQPTSSM